MAGLIILVSLGVLVAVVVSTVQRRSRLQPLWARAAADLGLPPPSGGPLASPSISGRVDGRHLTVRERSENDRNWIDYELAILRDLPAGLSIRSEHLGSRMPVVGKLFSGGREQVDTGDEAFDEAFLVTGDDPDEVRRFLSDERRDCLARLAVDCPDFELRRGELQYRFNDRSERIGDLARPARAMIAAARVLSPAGAGSASHRGRAGDDEAAAGQVFPAPRQPLPPPSGIEAQPGADDDVPAHRDSTADLPGLAEARHLDGAEDPAGAGASADQASALAAVFGVPAGAGVAAFEDRLRDRRVRWSGTVERAGRYANDLDLGVGPGIRAVVDLGPVDTGDYGVARVAAVAAFALDAAVVDGEPVTFEGTAASLDHFARRIVVTDARVVGG